MKRVLVVEDSPDERQMLRSLLEYEGCSVTTADGQDAAFAALGKEQPDAILLDIRLRGASGFDLVRRFRTMPELATTPIVAISAFLDSFPEEQVRAAGFSHLMNKPLSPHAVRQLLQRLWPDEVAPLEG